MDELFGYLERVVMHRKVRVNGGILRAITDLMITCFKLSIDTEIKQIYLDSLEAILVQQVASKSMESNKNSSCEECEGKEES